MAGGALAALGCQREFLPPLQVLTARCGLFRTSGKRSLVTKAGICLGSKALLYVHDSSALEDLQTVVVFDELMVRTFDQLWPRELGSLQTLTGAEADFFISGISLVTSS